MRTRPRLGIPWSGRELGTDLHPLDNGGVSALGKKDLLGSYYDSEIRDSTISQFFSFASNAWLSC